MSYYLTDYSATEVEFNDGLRSYYYKKCYCSVELQGEYIIFTSHRVENNAYRQQWSVAYTDFTSPVGSAAAVLVAIQIIIENYAGGGTGVTSVTATSPITSSGGATPDISISAATSSVNGYLSSTDWSTFNGKQAALGYTPVSNALMINTTAPLTGGGALTSDKTLAITQATTSTNGYLSSTDWNTFNSKGSGTVTGVTGTAPVVSSGGAAPAISMAAATTSVNGYLTSADWTTFNSKPNYVTAGNWNLGVQGGGTLGTTSLPGNIIKFYKIYIANAITVSRLGINVTAAGTIGSKGRLGIYSDLNGFPSALILDSGEFTCDSIAAKTLTGLSGTLPAGVAWLCSVNNSVANVTFNGHPISNLYPLGSLAPNGGTNANYTHYSGTFTYAALPANTSALTLSLLTTGVPAVYFYS